MSYVRTEQWVTWYTTPAELRALAAEMEAKWEWATLLPGDSMIVHQCSRGFNDPVGLSIRIAPELTNPQRPGTPGQDETASVPEPKRDGTEGETPQE